MYTVKGHVGNVFKMVRDRHVVTTDHSKEMPCGQCNGTISDDLR